MSEIKVNSIKGVGASAAAITVNNTDGTCTANLSNRQNRNLIINGAMQVAQRGTSFTASNSFPVDRFHCAHSGADEAPTFAQVDVASGTSPYAAGFRKCLKITNGNQTSGAGSSDEMNVIYNIEAQDLTNSGWDYSSTSSFVTFSFWIKSSVAQTFYGYMRSYDNTSTSYAFETGSLSANTWTKVTKTISGNSGLDINNDNGLGIQIRFFAYAGTGFTNNSTSTNAWATYNSSARTPDNVSTWYTTNDATLEITGVQLEVGSVATDFEHRSFGQELALCQRYFQKSFDATVTPATSVTKCVYTFTRPYSSGYHEGLGNDYVVEMRSQPSLVFYPTAATGSGSVGQVTYYDSGWSNASGIYNTSQSNNKRLVFTMNTTSGTTLVQYNYTLSAEL